MTRLTSNENYYDLFTEFYAFADQYDVPQLRIDLMTVLVAFESYLSKFPDQKLSAFSKDSIQCERLPQAAGLRV